MKEKVTTAEGRLSIPLNDLHHQSLTKEPCNDYHDPRNNIVPEFGNKQFYPMYKAPLLPDAAIIDKGLDKVTKSRGAMDNKSAHNNNKGENYTNSNKTKMVTVTDLIIIYLLKRT